MKTKSLYILLVRCALAAPLCFVSGCSPHPDTNNDTTLATRMVAACTSNLLIIDLLSDAVIGSGDHYPASFEEMLRWAYGLTNAPPAWADSKVDMSSRQLRPEVTNAWLFVCPGTGHTPGAMTNVSEWTDYVYIGGLPNAANDDRLPKVICPRAGGGAGFVLFMTARVESVGAKDIRRLIERPWCLASKLDKSEIEWMKTNVVVQVPQHLRAEYPHPYRPPTPPTHRIPNDRKL